jgi:hypothetical protein
VEVDQLPAHERPAGRDLLVEVRQAFARSSRPSRLKSRVLLGDFLDDLRGSGDLTRPVMLGEIGSPGAVVGTQTRVDRRSSLTALTA